MEQGTYYKVAKRDNNEVRPYLYVNPFQAKHIPADPDRVYEMLEKLAGILDAEYKDEKLMVIGFAETATAIGAGVALMSSGTVFYQHTTREECGDALYFTESHSHATDQKLATKGLKQALSKVDRVVFAEDEVTTGNTICKLIALLKEKYPEKELHFSILSVLNSMTESRREELEAEGIRCHYLEEIPFGFGEGRTEGYTYAEELRKNCSAVTDSFFLETEDEFANPRFPVSVERYRASMHSFTKHVLSRLKEKASLTIGSMQFCGMPLRESGAIWEDVLVLGTQECMFPAVKLAKRLKESGLAESVVTHSTTRSPILPAAESDYPLHTRYTLRSLYDSKRTVYVYDLKKYDKVILVTDSPEVGKKGTSCPGLLDLVSALEDSGCTDIQVVYWSAFTTTHA